MFYQGEPDKMLRFGDVVKGYISIDLDIKKPLSSAEIKAEDYQYKLDVNIPAYSVVLTPCCSIEDGIIALTPLIRVFGDFFKNPYFEEDLTRINRLMEPNQMLSPAKWKGLSLEEQEAIMAKGNQYALTNYFIYEQNDILKEYTLKKRNIRYYMIDFRNINKIKCKMIKRSDKLTEEDAPLLESKALQLSVETRRELRDKIAYYYYRPPEEDEILEE